MTDEQLIAGARQCPLDARERAYVDGLELPLAEDQRAVLENLLNAYGVFPEV